MRTRTVVGVMVVGLLAALVARPGATAQQPDSEKLPVIKVSEVNTVYKGEKLELVQEVFNLKKELTDLSEKLKTVSKKMDAAKVTMSELGGSWTSVYAKLDKGGCFDIAGFRGLIRGNTDGSYIVQFTNVGGADTAGNHISPISMRNDGTLYVPSFMIMRDNKTTTECIGTVVGKHHILWNYGEIWVK